MMNVAKAAAYALEQLKLSGAEQYSVQAAEEERREFNVDGGKFSLLRSTWDKGLDLSLIADARRGKVAINDFTEGAIDDAVKECLASARSAAQDTAWQLYPGEQRSFSLGKPEGDIDRLFSRSQELLKDIAGQFPKVMVEQLIVSHVRSEGLYLNSHGARYESLEGSYGLSLMFSAHEGDQTSSFNYLGLATLDLDTPFIEQGGIRQGLSDIEKQIHTEPSEGKFEGSVVFAPGCAEDVLGELLGNFVSDGVILAGTSPWKARLGEQVADERLTIRMAPHHEAVVCGERYLSDGRLSADYAVIQSGRLEQLMLSSYVANKVNGKPAPNSGGNMVVAPGDQSLEELIAGIDKGLLVSRFSGGSPSSNGDFSGIAKNSFLIEQGKIGPAVSETMISGNLARMVQKLRGISKEREGNGWRLMPWIAVDGITISGK